MPAVSPLGRRRSQRNSSIARCQQHKIRNVRDRLPQRLGGPVERRMRAAYHAPSALDAQAQLEALAREVANNVSSPCEDHQEVEAA